MVFKNVNPLPKYVSSEAPGVTLSAEQLKFYEDNGYIVLKKLIDPVTLHDCEQRFLEICRGTNKPAVLLIVKEPKLVEQNLRPEQYINKIQEIVYDDVYIRYGEHPNLLPVLSQLLGDDIIAINSVFFNKPPGASRHPAHQDLYYIPIRPAEKVIGCWTAIDRVTLDSGCLYVVPGSHKAKKIYPHREQKNALKLHYGVDEVTYAPPAKLVYLEMDPGDTLLINPYLVHGSGSNRSQNYRRSITFHFASGSCRYIDVNTAQEYISNEVQEMARKVGLIDMPMVDVWRLKNKQVKGVRSNL